MNLLIPVLGYILAVAGSFLLMKWVVGKASNVVGGGVAGLLGTANGNSDENNNSQAKILNKQPITGAKGGIVHSALRGAESFGRSVLGSAAIAGGGVGLVAGGIAKGAGKATKAVSNFGARKITGYVNNLAKEKYYTMNKEQIQQEDEIDKQIKDKEARLKDDKKENSQRYLNASKTRSAAMMEREKIKKEKEELVNNAEQWRNAGLGDLYMNKINDLNNQLNQADNNVTAANAEYEAAKNQALRLENSQKELTARKAELETQRDARYNEFMDRETRKITKIVTRTNDIFQKTGGALDTVGTGALHMLPFGVGQIKTVLTGKDLMADKLYDKDGKIAAISGSTDSANSNGTDDHGKITSSDMAPMIAKAQEQQRLERENRMNAIIAQMNGEGNMALNNNERIALETMVKRAGELTGTGIKKLTNEDIAGVFMKYQDGMYQQSESMKRKAAEELNITPSSLDGMQQKILSDAIKNAGLEGNLSNEVANLSQGLNGMQKQQVEEFVKKSVVNDPDYMKKIFGDTFEHQFKEQMQALSQENQTAIDTKVKEMVRQNELAGIDKVAEEHPDITDVNKLIDMSVQKEATSFMDSTLGMNNNGTQNVRKGRSSLPKGA